MIRRAHASDIDAIEKMATKTRNHMLSIGLKQWLGDYPNHVHFEKDLKLQGLYVYEENNHIYGSISILPENDPAYQVIDWAKHHSLVVHRLFVDPDSQQKGIGMALFQYAQSLTRDAYQSLKVDTHPDNHRMQTLIQKMGFEYKGYIESINRLAYEWLPLERN
jgi:GNAT superfamily N-acetyltransferase